MAYTLSKPVRIELQEYGEAVFYLAKDIDLLKLAEANKRWRRILGLSGDPIRVENLGNGLLKLRAEAVTGVIRIGNIDIEIAPKFLNVADGSWQTVLWRILTVVEGGHIDDNVTTADHLTSLSIPDLLAEMFLASYAKGAARGLPRGYLAEQGEGNILRGKLDTSRLGGWVAHPWVLPYVTDILTDDTALARLLRWSAECLAAMVKSPELARAMREITSGLAHIGKTPPHLLEAQRIFLGPLHQGLEAALVVGLLLLEGAGIHHTNGDHALSGFLWNSDIIYENYVYWLCRRAANQCGKRINKNEIKFGQIIKGEGSKLKTTPDVVFHDANGVPVAVTDAKYKRLGSRPKASDTYQVLTAGHVLGCQKVSLTYPVAINREITVWRVPSELGGCDIELTVLPINLMGLTQPGGQQALIDTIRTWLVGELFATD